MNVAYAIVGIFLVALGFIIYKTFRDKKELQQKLIKSEITSELKTRAIHGLEDSMNEGAELKRETNEKKTDIQNASTSELVDIFNSLSK